MNRCFLAVLACLAAGTLTLRSQESSTVGSENGYLILQGGGRGVPEIYQRFAALAGGPKAQVVLIPTALAFAFKDLSIPPERLERMKVGTMRDLNPQHLAILHTLDRKVADSEEFVEPLRHATGVWILGGDEGLLADTYRGTRTEREIQALVARGGVVGGTSAGANIFGTFLFLHPPGGDATPLKELARYLRPEGFGFLRQTALLSHFTQRHFETVPSKVLAIHPELLVIGIDEATSVVVHKNIFEVVGSGTVSVYDGKDHDGKDRFLLANGQSFDLAKREVVPK